MLVDVKGVYLKLKKERYILTTGFCKRKEKYFRILSKEKTTVNNHFLIGALFFCSEQELLTSSNINRFQVFIRISLNITIQVHKHLYRSQFRTLFKQSGSVYTIICSPPFLSVPSPLITPLPTVWRHGVFSAPCSSQAGVLPCPTTSALLDHCDGGSGLGHGLERRRQSIDFAFDFTPTIS